MVGTDAWGKMARFGRNKLVGLQAVDIQSLLSWPAMFVLGGVKTGDVFA
jgi:hypothetical protein